MRIEKRDFDVSIPSAGGAITEIVRIKIPMAWDEELDEWLMTEEGLRKIEETKARHMSLTQPS